MRVAGAAVIASMNAWHPARDCSLGLSPALSALFTTASAAVARALTQRVCKLWRYMHPDDVPIDVIEPIEPSAAFAEASA